jgi:ribosomal protein S18 acetylase RimI-like enzyme
MEILDLRHLRSRDLEALLDEESAVWQTDLRWDYTSSASLIKRYVDACSLPGFAAIDGGRAVGFSFYVYENRKGVVGDVFVSDAVSDETELRLLSHVMETLQGTPGVRRVEAQLMSLRRQPPPDYFARQNARGFLRRFMAFTIGSRDSGHRARAEDGSHFHVRPWDSRWTNDAAQLIAKAYEGHIDSQISDQYRSHPGAMRFLDNIIHYPGCGEFDARSSFVALNNDTSGIAGLVLCSVVGARVAHITQICVQPHMQGAGLGRALVGHAIDCLRDRNFEAVTLTVTDANHRAVELYEQMGFTTLKEFYALAWEEG